MIKTFIEIYNTCTTEDWENLPLILKWFLIVRPCVFSMDIFSVFIGALVSVNYGKNLNLEFVYLFVIVLFGVILAHAISNMINDYFDWKNGIDTLDYFRALYTPHPIVHGLTRPKTLLKVIFIFIFLDFLIALYLSFKISFKIMLFALAGIIFAFWYVLPGFSLKKFGLGEFAVFLVWGIIIPSGTYMVLTAENPFKFNRLIYMIPYGLLITSVLIGKHLDKYEMDKVKKVNTLPVKIGFKNSLILNKILFTIFLFYPILLIIFDWRNFVFLIVLFSFDRFLKVWEIYTKPKPLEPPEDYPVWPLWYSAGAFWFTRKAGFLYVISFILKILLIRRVLLCLS